MTRHVANEKAAIKKFIKEELEKVSKIYALQKDVDSKIKSIQTKQSALEVRVSQ